ncbi:MAG: 3-hydroxyacyl-CoA dehydrogenase [Gammaproteobacteria bacterium]|nr:3-hydroxyacyl-CoA dehydrogenase [Gammaproteobacteria bacterium]
MNGVAGGQLVGVVGAGTMGAGIAQVAAAAGHPVRLLDARPGAAAAARTQIATALSALVDKGRLDEGERSALLARITAVDALSDLAGAPIVIEVIVEDLAAKQGLLRELEAHVAPDAILASNTSTISVTAIAQGMRHPQRVVGMHFFNPVPQMRLVEVISGAETAPHIAASIFELAHRWGKTPVHAKSTPGFIVNRIARPFYAEALQLLLEQAGTPAQLDDCARGAGFRMGPCELMDLIGHDINYAVTQSVFNATYGDRRFQPSVVQKALVDGGRLGRKAGKGFYEGVPVVSVPVDAMPPATLQVHGDSLMTRQLAQALNKRAIGFERVTGSDWDGLLIDGFQMHLTDGRSAAQLAAERGPAALGVMDWPLSASGGALALAFGPGTDAGAQARAGAALAACGWQVRVLRDVPGLLVARTVAMLINEAAEAVWQGVCDEASVDQAMRLGTNYPMGPFEWLAQAGVDVTVTLLDNLDAAYRGERYRVSPLLRQRYWIERKLA